MPTPRIAVLSFPGNNCEVESLRAIKRAGMEAVFFKWNDSKEKLEDIDGYFIPGGFAYEDRGRAGMIAACDPILQFVAEEAAKGKVVIGNCNGAQVLVETGLIPLDGKLRMSLARNTQGTQAAGFLNEWVWVMPTCKPDRCATADWKGPILMPIAHGEGRFVTKDKDLIAELCKNDQIAFCHSDSKGSICDDSHWNPNGSTEGIAGICNQAGNVIALMPHPERTFTGDPYFDSMKRWIENDKQQAINDTKLPASNFPLPASRSPRPLEIFISTIIVNNEERSVEQALKRFSPSANLKQYRYIAPAGDTKEVLGNISRFNPNKESAFIRREGKFFRWDSDTKKEEALTSSPLDGSTFLRRDEPDTAASNLAEGSETGVCYVVNGIDDKKLEDQKILRVFANPHASTLEKM